MGLNDCTDRKRIEKSNSMYIYFSVQLIGGEEILMIFGQRSVDSAEANKNTVQALRNEGRGFLAVGDLPCGAASN
jgi:hypothetical protein